jgi:hypothetical protein
MPPAVAALFARREVVPVRAADKPAAGKRAASAAPELSAPPRRNLRRGSLLDILV